MTLSDCCIKVVKHEGTAEGTIKKLYGLETYVAGTPSKKVVVFLTDVFGHSFANNQFLADSFAKAGYYTVMPDLFNGDPVPAVPPKDFDLRGVWFPKHSAPSIKPALDKFLTELKADLEPEFVGNVAYCFGAVLAMAQNNEGLVDATCTAHPSMTSVEQYKNLKKPLYVAACEVDAQYGPELRHATEEVLPGTKVPYSIFLASGVEHGYAVRGDISNPDIKWTKEKCFSDMVAWFDRFSK